MSHVKVTFHYFAGGVINNKYPVLHVRSMYCYCMTIPVSKESTECHCMCNNCSSNSMTEYPSK